MGVPPNGWFIMENPWNSYYNGWSGGTPISGNLHIIKAWNRNAAPGHQRSCVPPEGCGASPKNCNLVENKDSKAHILGFQNSDFIISSLHIFISTDQIPKTSVVSLQQTWSTPVHSKAHQSDDALLRCGCVHQPYWKSTTSAAAIDLAVGPVLPNLWPIYSWANDYTSRSRFESILWFAMFEAFGCWMDNFSLKTWTKPHHLTSESEIWTLPSPHLHVWRQSAWDEPIAYHPTIVGCFDGF